MRNFSLGDIVKVPNKSGIYVGEIIEDRDDKYLVKVIAVLKHPMQGDLHHPKQVDGVIFHERKALALFEKVNVRKDVISEYLDEVPDYGISLMNAVNIYKEQLTSKDSTYNSVALKALQTIEESYYFGRYYEKN